jgi:hypothetical protein
MSIFGAESAEPTEPNAILGLLTGASPSGCHTSDTSESVHHDPPALEEIPYNVGRE